MSEREYILPVDRWAAHPDINQPETFFWSRCL